MQKVPTERKLMARNGEYVSFSGNPEKSCSSVDYIGCMVMFEVDIGVGNDKLIAPGEKHVIFQNA